MPTAAIAPERTSTLATSNNRLFIKQILSSPQPFEADAATIGSPLAVDANDG